MNISEPPSAVGRESILSNRVMEWLSAVAGTPSFQHRIDFLDRCLDYMNEGDWGFVAGPDRDRYTLARMYGGRVQGIYKYRVNYETEVLVQFTSEAVIEGHGYRPATYVHIIYDLPN